MLLSFAFCAECHNCKHGAPGYCANFTALNFVGNDKAFAGANDGEKHIGGSFFGQSSFAHLTRTQESSVVKVTDLVNNEEELKILAPLGCGIQVGFLHLSPPAFQASNCMHADWCRYNHRTWSRAGIGQSGNHWTGWGRTCWHHGSNVTTADLPCLLSLINPGRLRNSVDAKLS